MADPNLEITEWGGGGSGFIFHAVPAFVPPFVSSFLTKLQGGGGVGPPLNALKLA